MKILIVILICNIIFANGVTPNWSSARKVQVGTSLSKSSYTWFTNADGILTESYYPTIDTAQIKDSQILVSNGKDFFADEKYNTTHKTIVNSPSSVTLNNKHSKFSIKHTFSTAKDKSIIIDHIEIEAYEDNLDFYLLTNTAIKNTGFKDSGISNANEIKIWEEDISLYINSTSGFKSTSFGYVGVNDGHKQLRENYKLIEFKNSITDGNIALTAQLNIPKKKGKYSFYIYYSFNDATKLTNDELHKNHKIYNKDWKNYFDKSMKPTFASKEQENLYYRSLYTLKVHEDKKNPGALIASLSKPWGEELFEHPGVFTGGYHLVWPRDLFHVSLALLLSGDFETAENALTFLSRIQYQKGEWNFNNERVIPKAGAFPQNVWTNLNEYWGGLQIDQVGYPIHLFWQVYKRSDDHNKIRLLNKYRKMIFSASEFIYNYGPWSAQERWEENFGISPSSFSVATSALKIASKIFNDSKYENRANGWLNKPNDNIHTWTFTNSGEYGDGNYYVRVAGCSSFLANWNPNDYSMCTVANSGQRISMTKMLDQGFLKLSLLGLVSASDWRLQSSLNKVNENIKVNFGKYSGWYRYSFDAYGENKKGRIWPLLSGEHGRFEIEKYKANVSSWSAASKKVDNILESYELFANEGLMIPEQVFENSAIGTGAATPLAWSHAEFIKLLWSKELKINVENPF